jgi:hypothetical protein
MRKLIQYRGGGYDGCFWEWNVFMMVDGVFSDIYSSGRDGISSKADMHKLNKYNRWKRRDDVFVFNLDKPEKVKEFINESHPQLVLGVTQFIEGAEPDIPIALTCSCCDAEHEPSYMRLNPSDCSGNGGIGIVHHSYVCEDCLLTNTCDWCGGYSDKDWQESELKSNDDIQHWYDDEGRCLYCQRQEAEREVTT